MKFVQLAIALLMFAPIAAAAVAAGGSAPPAPPPTETTTPGTDRKFPIFAWAGTPTAEQVYRDVAAAGFTHTFSPGGTVEEVAKQLDLAARTGLKMVVHTTDLMTSPATVAQRLKDHPALGYYYLTDEPSAAQFDALAGVVRALKAVDADHPAYINLLPTYAPKEKLGTDDYRQHLDQFIAKVPVPFISFDHYPITLQDLPRADYYDNLEQVAAAGKRSGRPVWGFVMSVGIEGAYPVATLNGMRYQAFSNLAYGFQAIQFFTYWTPKPTHEKFHDAPYTDDGRRTPVYDLVKQLTGEIQNLRGVFLDAKVVSVGHTGQTLPAGTRRYEPADAVTALETTGTGAVVSLLARGASRSLVIVNRDVKSKMTLKIEFDRATPVARIDKSGNATAVDGHAHEATVDPADVLIFTWPAKGD